MLRVKLAGALRLIVTHHRSRRPARDTFFL
jgi:hypothetical protein